MREDTGESDMRPEVKRGEYWANIVEYAVGVSDDGVLVGLMLSLMSNSTKRTATTR